jgi:L,D-peptidoglycan transpeptidase YkuD (ErfK/YbiS/YcfS/YnhG family)
VVKRLRRVRPLVYPGVLAVTTVVVGVVPAGAAVAAPATPSVASVASVASAAAAEPLVRQLITVTAPSYGDTYATLRVYDRSGDKWVMVYGPWTARVGYNGVARPGKKREGDGTTPSGTFGFSFFFGVDPNLGFAFPFRHAYADDYWDDDPSSPSYNEWIDASRDNPGVDPEPMHNVPAYDYAAVIGYNVARVPGLGSAIFLHVGTGTPTAGCVSLPRPELIKVLHWLRPADHPKITISAR